MAYIENDVLEDVRDYLLDNLDAYCGSDHLEVFGSDVWTVLFEEPNANGTLDFDRQKSLDYLYAHPGVLETTIDYMMNEIGSVDWEDVYEWDDEMECYSNREYVETYAEALKVSAYIFIGQVVLQMCPLIDRNADRLINIGDYDTCQLLSEQISKVPLAEVPEFF